MDFDKIIKRIKEVKKLTYDVEVANLLGYTKNAFAERKRRNSIPQDKLDLLCERENININYLLTGEGSKFKEEKGGVVSQEGIQQGDIIKYIGLLPEEQALIDKLIGILRGKNKDNRKAIIENVNAFYKTRNVDYEDDIEESELKKTS
ncbi:exonuclease SbcC [Candidatus Kuenenia stuttgartiensis]|uniref:Exonuclease SbcC n=1 Tax=Kuenenia stuttgartiensis TaxID=174633 RepID=A0A6G7GP39_KUEST|nr:helix-turn-helix domain-containing protein [Candidatus Kuenenia stuttgartiensis]QII11201.1 exonuclease SbcC [Candidatus Kuenenia stuttgartiensis]